MAVNRPESEGVARGQGQFNWALTITYCVDFAKMFCLGNMALFICHDDWRLSTFLIINTPMILHTSTSGIVYESLARRYDSLTFLIILGSRFDSFVNS